MNNQQAISGAIALAVVVGVAGFFGYTMYQKNEQEKAMALAAAPFQSLINDYTSLPKPPAGDVRGANPKRKMITIDVKNKKVDWIYFQLPPELRATTPEEVESVVWLQWGEERVDEYQGGGWACRHTCTVTVFDKKTKKVLAQADMKGGEPPQTTNTPAGSNDYGDKPTDKILFYLRNVTGL